MNAIQEDALAIFVDAGVLAARAGILPDARVQLDERLRQLGLATPDNGLRAVDATEEST